MMSNMEKMFFINFYCLYRYQFKGSNVLLIVQLRLFSVVSSHSASCEIITIIRRDCLKASNRLCYFRWWGNVIKKPVHSSKTL